jgi:HK97 family phage major capsid protein
LEFQSDVAANNALAAGSAYVTTPAVAAILSAKQRFSSTDTPLWEGNLLDGRVIGFRAMSSQQMASGTMLFGDFSQVILGEWGVLELMVNPYSDFTRGLTGIRAWYTCDVAVRHPGAFSYSASVTA